MRRSQIWLTLMLTAALAVSAGALTPTEALNLTGTWSGRLSCDLVVDVGGPGGVRQREVQRDQTLEILMLDDLRFIAQIEGGITLFGAAMDNGTVTTRGKAAAQRCSPTAIFNRVLRVDATVNDTTGTGTMSGELLDLLIDDPGFIQTCRASFRRTSAAPPAVDPC
jgi:hypothetical protein